MCQDNDPFWANLPIACRRIKTNIIASLNQSKTTEKSSRASESQSRDASSHSKRGKAWMAESRLPPSDWLGRWCYFFLTNQSAAAQR